MDAMYQASNGRYYSEYELWEHYESGEWEYCTGESTTGQEVVQTERGELLLLTPIREAVIGGPTADTGVGGADADTESPGEYVDYVAPVGHCPDCGERLLYEDCLNCAAREEAE